MNRRTFGTMLAFALIAVGRPASAQNENRPRNRGGGGGQPVDVYQVLAVDTDARTLRLRASDGSESTVKVPEGVYELRKLAVGDRIQVNFYVPDAMNPGLRAAGIWPAN
jgi:hypothetical protein